jgi:hypothetical protein
MNSIEERKELSERRLTLFAAGAKRLSGDIRDMTGSGANIFFIACWYILSPLLILVSSL